MRASDTYVRARIDSATKERAADALAAMGLSISDAIRLLMMRIVDDLGRVAAVIEHHVGLPAAWTRQRLLDAPLVFLLGLALPGKDRDADGGDRRGGLILGREDVARTPPHAGTQRD